MKPVYVLSPPGEEDHYEQQGWAQIATVGALHAHYKALDSDQGTPNPLLALLVHDAEKERRSAK